MRTKAAKREALEEITDPVMDRCRRDHTDALNWRAAYKATELYVLFAEDDIRTIQFGCPTLGRCVGCGILVAQPLEVHHARTDDGRAAEIALGGNH